MSNILTMNERISYLEYIKKLESQIADLKSQLAECKEHYDYQAHLVNSLYKQISDLIDENKALEKQLASVKYLNTDEVEHIIGSINTNQEKVQAICNLAIPDIDRDKINQELLDQLYRFEGVMGKYDCQHGGMECNFQTAFHRLIRAEIDEIIKAIRGEE